MLTGILLGVPVLKLRGELSGDRYPWLRRNHSDPPQQCGWLTGGPQGIARLDKASIFGIEVARPVEIYWLLLVTVILVATVVWRMERSILGKAWAAIREDQDAARGIGINTTNAKLAAFATSATIGSIAGVIFAASQRFVSPRASRCRNRC